MNRSGAPVHRSFTSPAIFNFREMVAFIEPGPLTRKNSRMHHALHPPSRRSMHFPQLAARIAAALALVVALTPAPAARAQGGTANPHGALKVECAQCHSMEGWTPLKSPLVLRPIIAMSKRFMNPAQMRTAGTRGAYAGIIRHRGRVSGTAQGSFRPAPSVKLASVRNLT